MRRRPAPLTQLMLMWLGGMVLQFTGCAPAPRFTMAKSTTLPAKQTIPAPSAKKAVSSRKAPVSQPHSSAAAARAPHSVHADTMRFGMQMPADEQHGLRGSASEDAASSDTPPDEDLRPIGEGLAAYYGPGFNGHKTASGERFNMNGLTAAHRTLPFGTSVKVTNLNNSQSVIVRVNDRGPFDHRKIIDLSLGAARRIGLDKSGVARVKLEVVQ